MLRRVLGCWAVCAALLAACGGNEFSQTSGSGGTVSGGGAGAGGSSASGGSGATGGSAGSATGGSAGSATGGSAGVTSDGAAGSGGTGGVVTDAGSCPAAKPGCGFTSPVPLLYSTLDDAAAVTTPAKGQGSGQSNGSFVCGACGHALHVTQSGEFARFPAQNNIMLDKGSVDFFYRPSYPPGPGDQHNLVVIQNKLLITLDVTGSFGVGIWREGGNALITAIPAAQVSFIAGHWLRISVTWDFTQAGKNVHVYFDGQEIGANVPGSSGVQSMVTPDGGDELYLCANGSSDANNCNGEIDDFKVYDSVLTF